MSLNNFAAHFPQLKAKTKRKSMDKFLVLLGMAGGRLRVSTPTSPGKRKTHTSYATLWRLATSPGRPDPARPDQTHPDPSTNCRCHCSSSSSSSGRLFKILFWNCVPATNASSFSRNKLSAQTQRPGHNTNANATANAKTKVQRQQAITGCPVWTAAALGLAIALR